MEEKLIDVHDKEPQEVFELIIQKYIKNKHEFDEGSKEVMRNIFITGYNIGVSKILNLPSYI